MQDIVSVVDLVKRYGNMIALDHFTMEIERGEIFGLLGPNGSGKTTAINCILQLLTYDRGEIRLFGQPMTQSSYDLKRKIGIVPQNVAVFEELSVRENIDYFCGLYVSDSTTRRKLVHEAIEFVGLEDYEKSRPKKLSGGLLRRLNIACGIAHKPELIFFDEPTVAVDPQSRASILDGIKQMNANGSTIVYTSHYMEEVEEICTRIMIMDKGRTLACGTNEELKQIVAAGEKIVIEAEVPEGALLRIQSLPHVLGAQYDAGQLSITCENGERSGYGYEYQQSVAAYTGWTYHYIEANWPDSLNMLQKTQFDVLKIDRGFLSEFMESSRGRKIISHTISMSRDIGLDIIAEGVETPEQASFLSDCGCDSAQGFYYSKPITQEEFDKMLVEVNK